MARVEIGAERIQAEMNYWEGFMDWPKNANWKCETCQHTELVWGLIHSQCRCDICHTEYRMQDDDNKVVDIPICMLKEEYKTPARAGWIKFHTPISEWGDSEWDEVIAESARARVEKDKK